MKSWMIAGGIAIGLAAAIAAFAFRNDEHASTRSASLTHLANGRYTAQVMVNGQGPFDFIVDTGAQGLAVSKKLNDKLRLWGIPGVEIKGASGSQSTTMSVLRTYSSGVFSRSLVMGLALPNTAIEQDGIVGMDAFLQKRLAFEFERNLLTSSPSGPKPEGFIATPIEVRQNSFIIARVTLDGVSARAMLDTGARRTTGNLPLMKALGLAPGDPRLHKAEAVQGATPERIAASAARMHLLQLGPETFRDPEITFADLPVFTTLELDDEPAMIIGVDILHTVRVLAIDYPRSELQIKP